MLRSAEPRPQHGGKTINPALITKINPRTQRTAPAAEDTDSEASSLTSEDDEDEDEDEENTTTQKKTAPDEEKKPILTSTQASLLNGVTYHEDLQMFQKTLLHQRDWIAAALEEKVTNDIFEALQATGCRIEEALERIKNGTFRNQRNSAVQVLGVPMEDEDDDEDKEPDEDKEEDETMENPPPHTPLFRPSPEEDEDAPFDDGDNLDGDEIPEAHGDPDTDDNPDAEDEFRPEGSGGDEEYEPPAKRRASRRLATANRTPSNNSKGLTPTLVEAVTSSATKRPQAPRKASTPKTPKGRSSQAAKFPKSTTSTSDCTPLRVNPGRSAKQAANSKAPDSSGTHFRQHSKRRRSSLARVPSPPPPANNPEVESAEAGFRRLSSEIMDFAQRPSWYPPMRNDISDPFYGLFSKPFELPPGRSPHFPLAHYVKAQWDTALHYSKLFTNLRRGLDAYTLMFSWLRAVRNIKGWSPQDTRVLGDRLNPLLTALKHGERLIGHTAPPDGIPPLSSDSTASPNALSSGPSHSTPDLQLANPATTSLPAPTAAHADDDDQSSVDAEMELPADIDQDIKTIEDLLLLPTQVPIGTATDQFALFFDHPLRLFIPEDSDDGPWGEFVNTMDVHLGKTEVPIRLRRGPHGFDGLFRRWVMSSRGQSFWTSPSFDLLLRSKLATIKDFVEKQRIISPTSNHTSPPATGGSAQPASEMIDQDAIELHPPETTAEETEVLSSTLPTPRPTRATPAVEDPPSNTQAVATLTTNSPRSNKLTLSLPKVASPASPRPSLNDKDPAHEAATSPKALSAVLINPPEGVPLGGLPVPVNPDVRQVLSRSIWAVDSTVMFQATPKTVETRTIDNSDVPDIYRAALKLLCMRTRGTDRAALEAEPLSKSPFTLLPKTKMRVREWLAKEPNMRLFECAAEAPWHRTDVFRLDNAELIKKAPTDEQPHTQYVREILGIFCHSSRAKIDQSVRYTIAAVAYCQMENVEFQPPPAINSDSCPDIKIANGLRAAHHYHQLQLCTGNSTVRECVIAMWELVHKIYGMLEALATLRALFRHVELLFQAPEQQHEQIDADYNELTKSVGTGHFPAVPFGYLVAFLTSGVKGLFMCPADSKRFGPCKLAHFLVLVSRIHNDRPIEEPFWKHTQEFLLRLIHEALFPEGLDLASGLANAGVNDASIQDQWHPKECSKLLLTQAIQKDLAAFCQMRPVLTGVPYPDNPYDLPYHSVSTANETTAPRK